MKKLLIVIPVLALTALLAFDLPETITVKGTVYSAEDNAPLPGVNVVEKGTSNGTVTDSYGKYEVTVSPEATLTFSSIGFTTKKIKVKGRELIDVYLNADAAELNEVVVIGYGEAEQKSNPHSRAKLKKDMAAGAAYESADIAFYSSPVQAPMDAIQHNTEEYATIHENIFHDPLKNPLSTFSIDVDAASYSNMRRFINHGQLPPKDVVRIEELINYFSYDYKEPAGEDPFSINMELASCPWNTDHKLVHIGLQGKNIPTENLPPSNLVFLIDVSGSMSSQNKLPLLKAAYRLLVDNLRPQDRVAIVVYAGAAGLVLPSTPGSDKATILEAINNLQAGGSTAGGAGIQLAYKEAMKNFKEEGNNRIILATDGDFNIGASSNAEMERLIEEKRQSGVFLTVLGFGMGNYKDSKMEILADKGNGNYAYIDTMEEAKKVLVNEFGGTLFTIAKDVKIQVEFNPEQVKAYRLIGYENRKLNDEDFNDDRKDAGELGSGHTVTALYEIIPSSVKESPYLKDIDDLKYQRTKDTGKGKNSGEWMTVKLRYKQPAGTTSKLLTRTVTGTGIEWEDSSDNFKWSAAVASFGLTIRDSEFKSNASYDLASRLAIDSKGIDAFGYRQEFIRMIESVSLMARK